MRRQDTEPDKLSRRPDFQGPDSDIVLTADQSGEFPIRIGRDATWYYRNSPIARKEIAKLFSTVLQRDADGRYWLKTPVEQGIIQVEDAPFTILEMAVDGAGQERILKFRNNFDEWVTASAGHPIRVDNNPETGEPRPYIRVRDNLDALILRPVFYQLVEAAVPVRRDGRAVFGVWSAGEFFELGEE